jgi:hypothetical protein
VDGFIDHLYTRLVGTSDYGATAKLHKSQQHPLSLFQLAVSSSAVLWQRRLTVEIIQLHALTAFQAGHRLTTELTIGQRQSYLTPISLSWHQTP